jgi:hypothetical protein
MNRDEQIRKYLDGELTGEELEKFQNEINNSTKLKALVVSYKNTLNQFKRLRNDNIENPYFVNILPEVRKRIEKKKYLGLRPSFALGSVIVVLISLLAIFIFNNKEESFVDRDSVTIEISSEALDSYLSNYNQDFTTLQLAEDVPIEYDSLLNNVMVDVLELNNNSDRYFVDITSNEFYSVIDELSTEEVEGIYNSLIAKKIID